MFLLLFGLGTFLTIGSVSAQELSISEKTDMLINQYKNIISVYGSYQHAKTNVTLATSQSYILSSSGLGGVIAFNTNTIRNYYDGKRGVYLDHYTY